MHIKNIFLLLSLLFLLQKGEAYSPWNCRNRTPLQCKSLEGYIDYLQAGCLYESNEKSKCKTAFYKTNCEGQNPQGFLEKFCREISQATGKTTSLTPNDRQAIKEIEEGYNSFMKTWERVKSSPNSSKVHQALDLANEVTLPSMKRLSRYSSSNLVKALYERRAKALCALFINRESSEVPACHNPSSGI